MAYLGRAKKQILFKLAQEMGLEPDQGSRVVDLKVLITEDPNYDAEFVQNQLLTLQETEAENLEAERERGRLEAERERLDAERERLEAEKEREREQREFELEKLRIESANRNYELARTEMPPRHKNDHGRELRSRMQKFDPDETDIALYLALFERQARKLGIEEGDLVSHLIGLLPMEVAQTIMREPEAESENYDHIKGSLLQRYKLNPEAFRVKFTQLQRKTGALWKDFAFELQNYLEGWITGVGVSDFKGLMDLMLTDQIKRRVPADIREHFVDLWAETIDSGELTSKLDQYEIVRRTAKKPPGFGKLGERKVEHPFLGNKERGNRDRGFSNTVQPSHRTEVGQDSEVKTENSFEQRKIIRCYNCQKIGHIRPNCPSLIEKEYPERVNKLIEVEDPTKWLQPYVSKATINGKAMQILRDSGSTIDLVSKDHVDSNCFLGETVAVKQPLDTHVTILPLAKIQLEIGDSGVIYTKAGVIDSKLDHEYYLLGNRTAALLGEKGNCPEGINAIITRAQHKPEKKSKDVSPPRSDRTEERTIESPTIESLEGEKYGMSCETCQEVGNLKERKRGAHLTIKPSKCKFAQNHEKYLEHIVCRGSRSPTKEKIQAIANFPRPTTKTKIRTFLRLAGHYSHYIPRFFVIAAPLTRALKGRERKGKVDWSEECEAAFLTLKQKLAEKTVLYAPNFKKEFMSNVYHNDRPYSSDIVKKKRGNQPTPHALVLGPEAT